MLNLVADVGACLLRCFLLAWRVYGSDVCRQKEKQASALVAAASGSRAAAQSLTWFLGRLQSADIRLVLTSWQQLVLMAPEARGFGCAAGAGCAIVLARAQDRLLVRSALRVWQARATVVRCGRETDRMQRRLRALSLAPPDECAPRKVRRSHEAIAGMVASFVGTLSLQLAFRGWIQATFIREARRMAETSLERPLDIAGARRVSALVLRALEAWRAALVVPSSFPWRRQEQCAPPEALPRLFMPLRPSASSPPRTPRKQKRPGARAQEERVLRPSANATELVSDAVDSEEVFAESWTSAPAPVALAEFAWNRYWAGEPEAEAGTAADDARLVVIDRQALSARLAFEARQELLRRTLFALRISVLDARRHVSSGDLRAVGVSFSNASATAGYPQCEHGEQVGTMLRIMLCWWAFVRQRLHVATRRASGDERRASQDTLAGSIALHEKAFEESRLAARLRATEIALELSFRVGLSLLARVLFIVWFLIMREHELTRSMPRATSVEALLEGQALSSALSVLRDSMRSASLASSMQSVALACGASPPPIDLEHSALAAEPW